jgi:hypothetical protein
MQRIRYNKIITPKTTESLFMFLYLSNKNPP